MATVLILATDQMIGGLLGQLTDLAGHAAQFRCTGEEPSEAVRKAQPDVVMLDSAYGRASMDVVARAAGEVGAAVVYFASALPAGDLRRFALERRAKYFALPAGPKLLGRVLADALRGENGGDDASTAAAARSAARSGVTAAVAAVTRARLLVARAAAIRSETQSLRFDHESALADCRRSQAELREAVIAYTRELRYAGTPPDQALALVKDALRSDAVADRAPRDVDRDLDDAVEWCLQAYYAA